MSAPDNKELERRVGHPAQIWEALQQGVQADAIQRFSEIENYWLRLMWALDAFRVAGVVPTGMTPDLEALNRNKGNWFAELLALLLQNQTSQRVGARGRVQGFSQRHQVDLAWPAREVDPLVCAETKVTGGPAYGTRRRPRGAMDDWSNRRKELKFAATDLKLYRRQQETVIRHWNVWRQDAPPKTYFLWAARLRTGQPSGNDSVQKMVEEAQALINTYLDGAGIFAWQVSDDETGYVAVPLPSSARVTGLDDVLYQIASEIGRLAPTGVPPEPVVPAERAVRPEDLIPDETD